MSIEEKFEKFISNRKNIDKVILKALPAASLVCFGLGYYVNNKAWKYALFSYSIGFAVTSLYCYYKKFEEKIKNYKKINFTNKGVGEWI